MTARRAAPRRGLVLGGGGVLGAAWMIGALVALREARQWDPREAAVFVGTSAGSVLVALLAAGVPVDTLADHQRGVRSAEEPQIRFDHDSATGGALPPRPRLGIGSTALLARAAVRPRRFPPLAAFSAIAPHGRANLAPVGALVDAVVPPGQWAPHPAAWVIAMDYDLGRRVAFGRTGSPPAGMSDAVMASCAIPGWYQPVRIGGRRYVDGGTCSPTSLDLLAGAGLDEVIVLAPMVSWQLDAPDSMWGRLERRLRRAMTRRVRYEAAKVTRRGTPVLVLGPTPTDLAAIGVNLMDPRRRRQVFETSLATSTEVLASGVGALPAVS